MPEYHFTLPVKEEDIRKVRVGDTLYVTGRIVSARDAGHRRALETLSRGEKLPIDLSGSAVYHLGPVVKKVNGEWKILSAGPTTSARMEAYEHELIEKTGVRLIIGKGGMGPRTAEACRSFGAVYAIFTGGAAALAARSIRRVVDVHWLDLGTPEAMWVMDVEKFGPLIATIDPNGVNFYDDVYRQVRRRVQEVIYPKLGIAGKA